VTGGGDMDGETRVHLTRIEGKIDLLNQRHESMKEDMRKIELTQADYARRTDERLHSQGNRIQLLESKEILRQGEQQGVTKSVKIAWMLSGLGGGGLGCALLVHFLHL
jgi:hypothetical protein